MLAELIILSATRQDLWNRNFDFIPLNGLKFVIFNFFVKMTKIQIFDFEPLKLRKVKAASLHMNIISSTFRVYAIT